MNIDIRTLMIAHSLQNIIFMIIMGLVYLETRKSVNGPKAWFIGSVCYALSLGLVAARGFIPDILSFEISTFMMMLGALQVPLGTALFFGKKPLLRAGCIALLATEAAYVVFMRVVPDTGARIVLFSSFVAAAYLTAAVRAWHASRGDLPQAGASAVLFLSLGAAVNILRVILYYLFSNGLEVFDARSTDKYLFLVSLIIFPGVTFTQMQLINGRLMANLRRAANERGLLVKEMNHRVKNSLAMAESLVALQSSKMGAGPCHGAMENIRFRLHSISLIHDRLNKTDAGNRLRVDHYLKELSEDIAATAPHFSVVTEFPPFEMDSKIAATLGILVNELITNAIKYAGAPDGSGKVNVRLKEVPGGLLLRVSDSGPGFGPDIQKSLGTELVDALAEELGGTVRRFNDSGAVVEVSIGETELEVL